MIERSVFQDEKDFPLKIPINRYDSVCLRVKRMFLIKTFFIKLIGNPSK